MHWCPCAWNKSLVLKWVRVRWYEVQTTCASHGWRILYPWERLCAPLPSNFPSPPGPLRCHFQNYWLHPGWKLWYPFHTKNTPKWLVVASMDVHPANDGSTIWCRCPQFQSFQSFHQFHSWYVLTVCLHTPAAASLHHHDQISRIYAQPPVLNPIRCCLAWERQNSAGFQASWQQKTSLRRPQRKAKRTLWCWSWVNSG